MANTENIEAKLAAYIEGELDAADRAEIERHLEGNPQHRKLLADLSAMRGLIGQLPRDSAPPEILDRVQQQIERNLLLDGPTEEETSLKINHWPSRLALAAMLLLASGLVVVVIYALPGRGKPRILDVAMNPSSAPAMPTEDGAVKSRDKITDSIAPKPAAAPEGKSLAETTPDKGVSDHFGFDKEKLADKELSDPNDNDTSRVNAIAGGAGGRGPERVEGLFAREVEARTGGKNAMYVVVSTENPTATSLQLNDYLTSNRLAWEPVPEPSPEPIRGEVAMGEAKDARGDSKWEQAQAKPDIANNKPAKTAESQVYSGTNATNDMQQASNLQRNSQKSAADLSKSIASAPPQKQMILLHNVTRQQVKDLNLAMAGNTRLRQKSEIFDLSNVDERDRKIIVAPGLDAMKSAPGTQPTIAVADSLRITVDELVGPGVDKTTSTRVQPDGTIAMPMVESIHAAGLSEDALKSRIAQTYRDAQLIPNATVSLAKLPTTQPAEVAPAATATGQLPAATSQPADAADHALHAPVVILAPTTMPSSTQPADRLDVVIVVNPTILPAAAAATTQP